MYFSTNKYVKYLSSLNTLFDNPRIFATCWLKPSIFQILTFWPSKCQRSKTSGYNYLGIRKLGFAIIAHLLYKKFILEIKRQINIWNKYKIVNYQQWEMYNLTSLNTNRRMLSWLRSVITFSQTPRRPSCWWTRLWRVGTERRARSPRTYTTLGMSWSG